MSSEREKETGILPRVHTFSKVVTRTTSCPVTVFKYLIFFFYISCVWSVVNNLIVHKNTVIFSYSG